MKMKTPIKTLLIPVMGYPSVPVCMASRTQKIKIQTVLNKPLRFIHCNKHEQISTLELHIKYLQYYSIKHFNPPQGTKNMGNNESMQKLTI